VAPTDAGAERLTFAAARRRVLAAAPALAARLGREDVALDEAAGRVLAEPLVADAPLPHFDRSTVDGYAARAADLAGTAPGLPPACGWSRRSPPGAIRCARWGPARPRW